MGREKRQYSEKEQAAALAYLDTLGGGNVSASARTLGIPARTLAEWAKGRVGKDVPEQVEEAKEEMADKIERILDCLAGGLADPQKIKDAPLSSLSTAFGTLFDKLQLVKGQPTGITRQEIPPTAEERAQKVAELIERGAGRLKLAG